MNAHKDFSGAVRKALRAQGISVYSSTWIQGMDGTFANGERAYLVDDNGMSCVRTYSQVIAMALVQS